MRPHNLPLVMLGAGLLWFGWFGFNAGSALGAGNTAAVAWINTHGRHRGRHRSPGSPSRRSGTATPPRWAPPPASSPAWSPSPRPAASVNPVGAIVLGVIAGVALRPRGRLKFKLGYDDSLDVVGVHLVGGLVGTLLIGFLATDKAPAGVNGLFYGGGVDQLWRAGRRGRRGAGVLLRRSPTSSARSSTRRSASGSTEEDEVTGIDLVEHAESAYELGSFSGSGFHTGAGVGTTRRVDA